MHDLLRGEPAQVQALLDQPPEAAAHRIANLVEVDRVPTQHPFLAQVPELLDHLANRLLLVVGRDHHGDAGKYSTLRVADSSSQFTGALLRRHAGLPRIIGEEMHLVFADPKPDQLLSGEGRWGLLLLEPKSVAIEATRRFG